MSSFVEPHTIDESVRSSIFISYSRAQKRIANELAQDFRANSNSIWFDRDAIAVGDNWIEEIRSGIERCDEFLTLVSFEALQSKVVAKELEIANQLRKPIFPVVFSECTADLPEALRNIHYLEIEDESDVDGLFAQYFRPVRDDISNLKILATRSVYPEFNYQNRTAFGRNEEAICRRLESLEPSYSSQSAILLNKGLLDARNENWEEALPRLKRYANSADNFAGWYFYALHLPRRKNLRTLSPHIVDEIIISIERAEARGSSPLIKLYHELVLVAGCNYSPLDMPKKISDFELDSSISNEKPSEFLRFLWCTKDSLSTLGTQKSRIVNFIKEKSK